MNDSLRQTRASKTLTQPSPASGRGLFRAGWSADRSLARLRERAGVRGFLSFTQTARQFEASKTLTQPSPANGRGLTEHAEGQS